MTALKLTNGWVLSGEPERKEPIHTLDFDNHCTFCTKNRNQVKNLIVPSKKWQRK